MPNTNIRTSVYRIFQQFPKTIILMIVLTTSSIVYSSVGEWTRINQCAEYAKHSEYVHVVRIDPKCQGLKIVGSKYEDKGMTTGEFANTYNTDIAINANFSRNDPGNAVLGSVMTDGIAWPSAPDTKDHTMFHCDNENNCNIETMSRISTVPNNTTLIVSGWQVYKNGKFECPINGIVSCHLYNGGNRSPRSIIGMGVDKNIYLFSIEGRLTDFQGANLTEMSKIMNKYSITNALNLDGGGSTTLVIDGERVNRLPGNQPNERVVPNHIGFKVE